MRIAIPVHRHGPALWPAAFSLPVLQARLRALGSALFQTIYQGEPVASHGAVFRWEWFPTYTCVPQLVEIGQAWDTALKGGREHDYSCGITAGRSADGGIYLLDCWRGQVETPQLARQMRALAARWRPRWILIEDAAAGPALLAFLRAEHPWPFIPVRADADKRRRAASIAPHVEGGLVRRPESAPWLEAFRDEVLAFPDAPHDDQVDAFVYLIQRFVAHPAPTVRELAHLRRPAGW